MDITKLSEDISTTVSAGKVVAKYVSNTSLTKLARDSIFQFPVIISASIDNDEIFVMAKALERTYASMMVSVISMSSYIDLSKYGKENYMVKFLRRFHSNTNIGGEIIANESFSIESANILPQENSFGVNMASLWDSAFESCDMTSINSMYQPYNHTKHVLETALEASGNDPLFGKKNAVTDTIVELSKAGKKETVDSNNKPIMRGSKEKNAVIKSEYMTDMAPTMINITVVADATGKGATWTQSVVIGIKSMVRMVKSSVMVSNMLDAFKDRGLFKWIAWTNGEISTAELIFGVGKAAKDGYAAGKGDNWLKKLRERKIAQNVNKLLGKRLLPNASIIITETEAIAIQEVCGIDVHNPADATKMMNRYFLLAFGIYDTEAKMLSIIYDGEYQFSTESIRELVAKNKKDTNLLTGAY